MYNLSRAPRACWWTHPREIEPGVSMDYGLCPNADTLLTDYRAWPENNFPRPHSSPPLFFSPSLSFPPSLFLFPSFLRRGPPGFFPSLLFSFFTLPVHQGFHLLTRALSPRGVEKDTGLDHVLLFPPFISFSFFLALFLSGPGICFPPLLDFRNIERAGRHSSRHELQVRLDSRSSSGTSGIYVGRCCFQCRISKSNVIRIGVRIIELSVSGKRKRRFVFFVFIFFFSLHSTCLWSCSEINSRNEVSNFAMAPI